MQDTQTEIQMKVYNDMCSQTELETISMKIEYIHDNSQKVVKN